MRRVRASWRTFSWRVCRPIQTALSAAAAAVRTATGRGGWHRTWRLTRSRCFWTLGAELRYQQQQLALEVAHRQRGPEWPGADERFGFRGTPYLSASTLLSSSGGGFKQRHSATTAYGCGTYFSAHASYAHDDAKPCAATRRRVMVVSRLLVNGAVPTRDAADLAPGWHLRTPVPALGLPAFPALVGCDRQPDPHHLRLRRRRQTSSRSSSSPITASPRPTTAST